MEKEAAKTEYIDVSSNLRHWNTLRFAELTIFIAITGAMMNVAFGRAGAPPWQFLLLVKIAGLIASILFYILQERTMMWWYTFVHGLRSSKRRSDSSSTSGALRPA